MTVLMYNTVVEIPQHSNTLNNTSKQCLHVLNLIFFGDEQL